MPPGDRVRELREQGLLLLVAALSTVAVTWPALIQLETHLGGPLQHPDLQCGLWWPDAVARALAELRDPFVNPLFGWPEGQDVHLLVWNLGAQLLFAPLHALGSAIFLVNAMTLGSMVLNGWASGAAARLVTGSRPAGVGAAVLGAASAYAFIEGSFGRPEQCLFAPIPLYLAALVRLRLDPGRRSALLLGAGSLAAAGAIYWFDAYFLVVITLALAAGHLWARALGGRHLRDLVLVGLGSLVLVLPFLLPVALALLRDEGFYAAMRDQVGDPVMNQLRAALVFPRSFLGPLLLDESRLRVLEGTDSHTSQVASLLAVPLLTAVLWRERREARLFGWAALLALLFTVGPLLQLRAEEPFVSGRLALRMPSAALNLLPGFTRFWWPYRWLGVVVPAVAVCGGLLVARARRPWLLVALLGVVGLVECRLVLGGGVGVGRPHLWRTRVPEVFAALGAMGGVRPILQLPMSSHVMIPVGYQAWHRQPVDGGLGWGVAEVRSAAWEARKERLPLWRALANLQVREVALPPGGWTAEDTGGFHYVLLYPGALLAQDLPEWGRLQEVLGWPFYCDRVVAAWAIPGVGEVPPAYRHVVEQQIDPCPLSQAGQE